TFGEISDDIPTKYHLPLGTNIWGMFKQSGWEFLKHLFSEFIVNIYDLCEHRLNESIFTARDRILGKIPEWQANKIMTYAFFSPISPIRNDLQRGVMKLLFGESGDVTFLIIHDFKESQCGFALNLHTEDGIPVDWWVINEGDEFFDRRHMRLGIKLKDIPKKSKSLDQAADRIISTLYDARNERTPQWSDSYYNIVIIWCSATLNMIAESSSFETLGCMFDGMVSKFTYKLKDYWYNIWPRPPMMGTFTYAPERFRSRFLGIMAGLLTEHRLYISPLAAENRPLIEEKTPEYLQYLRKKYEQKGIVMPYQSSSPILPNFRNKKIYKKADEQPDLLERRYPDDPEGRIKMEDLGFTFEEILDGAYLDITMDSRRNDVSPDIIISKKSGRQTEFLWKEYTEESKARVKDRTQLRSAAAQANVDMGDIGKLREGFTYRKKNKEK
ncbi:MAG: hypothetical protein HWN66_21340, partial [Candidatus Helarchaeota archaeon]|nr:hypothetical protein [Candidatus Helarchaeota archaeon]